MEGKGNVVATVMDRAGVTGNSALYCTVLLVYRQPAALHNCRLLSEGQMETMVYDTRM